MERKNAKDRWSMLMKFGAEENLKKLRNGQLYMKNLQYYVDLEKTTNDTDVGDKYDGQMVLEDVTITMYNCATGAFVARMNAPVASMNLGYLKCPVFCMFMFDYRNHTGEELINDTLKVRYQLTEEQVEKMPSLGSSVLIIKNGNEFMERVKSGLLREGYGYSRDFVNYYDGNCADYLREIAADDRRIAFWKRKKYGYQQEYRLLVHTQVEEHLCIDIGDLSDITELVPTSVLLNAYMEADYKVIVEEE